MISVPCQYRHEKSLENNFMRTILISSTLKYTQVLSYKKLFNLSWWCFILSETEPVKTLLLSGEPSMKPFFSSPFWGSGVGRELWDSEMESDSLLLPVLPRHDKWRTDAKEIFFFFCVSLKPVHNFTLLRSRANLPLS